MALSPEIYHSARAIKLLGKIQEIERKLDNLIRTGSDSIRTNIVPPAINHLDYVEETLRGKYGEWWTVTINRQGCFCTVTLTEKG